MFQVGSRNMANQPLLRELGQQRKPVLLKRGFAATLREFLLAKARDLAPASRAAWTQGVKFASCSSRVTTTSSPAVQVRAIETLRLPVVWLSIVMFFVFTGLELSGGYDLSGAYREQ